VLARLRKDVADAYVLGPVRAAVGALLGWHALLAAQELNVTEHFGTSFHMSMLPDVLVPSHRLYAVVVALRICLAVMITIGVWARPGLAISGLLGLWILLCDRLQFHHDRYSLFLYAVLLSLTPCDRSWRASEPSVPEPRIGSWWAVYLTGLQISIVYLASGGSKLLDPDWRSGLVLSDRIARHGGLDWLARADVTSALAKAAIMTELVLCAALWIKPTRVVAIWWGLWFHLAVLVLARVETFTILQLAMFGVFVTPDFHARRLRFDPSRPWGKLAGTAVPLLDWFGRFEVKGWEPDDQPGHSIVVVRRDGTNVTGIRAFAMITRCVPLLFPLWAPVALFASFTRQGDLTTRG
jgi:Vitamin K-dependent gamma-carboxylase